MKEGSNNLIDSDGELFFPIDNEDLDTLLSLAEMEKEAQIEEEWSPIRKSRLLVTGLGIVGALPSADRPRSPSVHQKPEEETQRPVRKYSF